MRRCSLTATNTSTDFAVVVHQKLIQFRKLATNTNPNLNPKMYDIVCTFVINFRVRVRVKVS